MKVETYLFFNGRCEEAIEFYKHAVGAKVTMLMRNKEAPDKPPPGMLPPSSDDKIMHASFTIGDTTVMASDRQLQRRARVRGILDFGHRRERSGSRARVQRPRRRRAGAHAARQDVLLAGVRHAARPLRRRLDGTGCGVTATGGCQRASTGQGFGVTAGAFPPGVVAVVALRCSDGGCPGWLGEPLGRRPWCRHREPAACRPPAAPRARPR